MAVSLSLVQHPWTPEWVVVVNKKLSSISSRPSHRAVFCNFIHGNLKSVYSTVSFQDQSSGGKKWKNVQTSLHGNDGITGVFNKTFIGTFSGVVALAEMVPLWIWNSAADEMQ